MASLARLTFKQSLAIRSQFPSRSLHLSAVRSNSNSPPLTSEIEKRLRDGLKAAMKGKNKPAVTVLKAILADVMYNVKSSANPNEAASQETIINTLRKGIDKRVQAALSYAPDSSSPHPEQYSALEQEIALLKTYLPTAPSPESVQAVIREVIEGLPEDVRSGKGATGAVMKTLWERLGDAKAAIDKKEVAKWVNEALKK